MHVRTAAALLLLLLVAVAGPSLAASDTAGTAGPPGFREVPVAMLPCGERTGQSRVSPVSILHAEGPAGARPRAPILDARARRLVDS
jgi:hypothetical protein